MVGGEGPRFTLESGESLLDATCSWWCMIHGYRHPRLVRAIQQQADELCHVMLGGLTHEPADRLARELVRITPEGLNHVFYSDSGSVGMEVAMKMAVQYQYLRGQPNKHRMLSLMKAYHGDTAGCMAVCDPEEGMHSLFAGFLPQHHFAPAPTAPFDADDDAVQADLDALRKVLEEHHHEIAALLMEPLLQAAGGLNMTSPAYLRGARRLCDEFDVLLILDEVATGFGRTGRMFAAEHAEVTPDIMVLSKGLTGGYLGHAATLATDRVHDTFIGDSELHAFMHGPTFMGNPWPAVSPWRVWRSSRKTITWDASRPSMPYCARNCWKTRRCAPIPPWPMCACWVPPLQSRSTTATRSRGRRSSPDARGSGCVPSAAGCTPCPPTSPLRKRCVRSPTQ
ncbi:adenosylmethionine-8-amino-7-oxononanoate aminotransferase [Halomonas elongata]|uniref:adenosylmethionine--8-amino-7-oxononanoate transaminase n=1 Tax=Halomonas elongata TaxID=2746 RepID=A0A1B8P488_HALEL|nr:adenosylmethionine-8-amino-7-oxononanoate aminotransferase [Halomonas elongata]